MIHNNSKSDEFNGNKLHLSNIDTAPYETMLRGFQTTHHCYCSVVDRDEQSIVDCVNETSDECPSSFVEQLQGTVQTAMNTGCQINRESIQETVKMI